LRRLVVKLEALSLRGVHCSPVVLLAKE
jgi:hypothetical protein